MPDKNGIRRTFYILDQQHKFEVNVTQSLPILLTVPEFIHHFGIGRTKTYEEINQGRLAAKKIGTRTFIPSEAANAWLDTQPDYKSIDQV